MPNVSPSDVVQVGLVQEFPTIPGLKQEDIKLLYI